LNVRATIEDVSRRLRSGFLGGCLQKALEIDAVARAVALASQAFTAGIPFAIVVSALSPRGKEFADRLIHRFHLSGSTADQVRTLFLAPNDVRGAVTWIGVIFLIISMMSLAGSLQVLYERTLNVSHIGLRARWRAAVWLLGGAAYIGWFVELKPNIYSGGTNIPRALLSVLASIVFWLWTPRILLGPRTSWRRVAPIAALTSTAVAILTVASPLYMPNMIRNDASRFGTIGVAFSLFSWLVVLAFLIVGSAVVASQVSRRGAVIADRAGAADPQTADPRRV
jgi:membrane protein